MITTTDSLHLFPSLSSILKFILRIYQLVLNRQKDHFEETPMNHHRNSNTPSWYNPLSLYIQSACSHYNEKTRTSCSTSEVVVVRNTLNIFNHPVYVLFVWKISLINYPHLLVLALKKQPHPVVLLLLLLCPLIILPLQLLLVLLQCMIVLSLPRERLLPSFCFTNKADSWRANQWLLFQEEEKEITKAMIVIVKKVGFGSSCFILIRARKWWRIRAFLRWFVQVL